MLFSFYIDSFMFISITKIIFLNFFIIIVYFVFILVFVAFFTLIERKFMALLQRREGPDKVGVEGIFQPIADGVKLLKKEFIKPKDNMSSFIFNIAPMISFSISLLLWGLVPINSGGAFSNSSISILLFLGFSSLGSYGVIYSGWVSNNKYALMGALRSIAQIISYEIIFSIVFMPAIAITSSFNFFEIIKFQEINGWFIWYFFPIAFIFFTVSLAETNRTPFDLPEAEAELVSGYNVEYSSLVFALFFLAEYSSMGVISALFVVFFFGGWSNFSFIKTYEINSYFFWKNFFFENIFKNSKNFFFFVENENLWIESLFTSIKIVFICIIFIFVRAALPRKRFDQLIHLCWKYFFIISISIVIFYISIFSFVINFYLFCLRFYFKIFLKMKELSRVKPIRTLFFLSETIKFFIKTLAYPFIKIFIILFKSKKIKNFIFITILTIRWLIIENRYGYGNYKKIEINFSELNNIANTFYSDLKQSVLINESGEKFFNFNQFIKLYRFSDFINKVMEAIITSNITVFFVFYSTYFFIKEKNPTIFICNHKYDKDMRQKIIYNFLKKHFEFSFFFQQSEEEIKIQIDLVIEIFNQMLKSEKIAERIGINYFLWSESYLQSKLNRFLFKQMIFFKKVEFSEESKQNAVWIAKQMLDYSRYELYSENSKYVCYSVNF